MDVIFQLEVVGIIQSCLPGGASSTKMGNLQLITHVPNHNTKAIQITALDLGQMGQKYAG